MTCYAEVQQTLWIAAPLATVRAHFADLQHHIEAQVHSQRRYELLAQYARGARFVQMQRWRGAWQRNVIERRIDADGSVRDAVVEGPNLGATQSISFYPHIEGGQRGTRVGISLRVPLPQFFGAVLRPLLAAQLRKELGLTLLEDRADIERRAAARTLTGAYTGAHAGAPTGTQFAA